MLLSRIRMDSALLQGTPLACSRVSAMIRLKQGELLGAGVTVSYLPYSQQIGSPTLESAHLGKL